MVRTRHDIPARSLALAVGDVEIPDGRAPRRLPFEREGGREEARPSSDSDRPAEDGDPRRRPMGATEEGRVGTGERRRRCR